MSAVPSDYSPPRVVCLQPSATVILAAIGRLDRVVACTRYCADVCPEVKTGGRSIIADSWTAQSRQILAARPDLVIAAVPYHEKAVVEILKAGVRFAYIVKAGSTNHSVPYCFRQCTRETLRPPLTAFQVDTKANLRGVRRSNALLVEWTSPCNRRPG